MTRSGKQLELMQTLLIALPSFVLFGWNQAGVGGLLSIESWLKTFPAIDVVHAHGQQKATKSTLQGTIVATCTLGALFGSLACASIGDILGRRKTVLLAAIFTLIGEVLECTSFGLVQFTIGRFIVGLGVGALSTTVPVWQSECSRAKNRGQHVIVDGIFITFGFVLQAWVNLGMYQVKEGSLSWRIPLALPAIISLILIASVYLVPESPRWLASKGHMEHARNNLSKLRDEPVESFEIATEMNAIELTLESTKSAAKKRDLFKMGEDKALYRFLLCLAIQFFQQWCGSNLISSYSTIIFERGLGLDHQTARILSGGCLTWKMASSFIAFFTVDRFGRRKLFMFSGFGMSMCMTALAITNSFPRSNKPAQIASVFFIFFFNFFVPIGFLGCNYLYVTEVAPTRLRMPMASFSTANHWLWNFAVLMITPVAITELGYRYYILYAILGACIPAMVFFFFPETNSRSLEQMETLFRDHDSIFGVVKASLTPQDPEVARLAEATARKEYDNKIFDETETIEKRA